MTSGTDLAVQQDTPVPATPRALESAQRSRDMMEMVKQAMLNPDVDADKAKAMMDMMVSWDDRERQSEFNRDFNAAVQEMPVITKDGKIVIPAKDGKAARVQGRFARYEDIDRVVRPIAAAHNLAYTFEVDHNEKGMITVRPVITHANGFEKRGGAMPLPMDTSGGKNNVQGSGSAVTYGKRYTLCAAFNIVTEGLDDDGNLAAFADLPFERRTIVEQGAEEAAAAGNYQQFFASQSPRDRAFLVQNGFHERYGGAALPAPKPDTTHTDKPGPVPETKTVPDQKRTPEGMVEDYRARVQKCETVADLQALQTDEKVQKWIGTLREKQPALFERVIEINSERLSVLTAGQSTDGSDLFGGEGK